jgi:hypothetical protein
VRDVVMHETARSVLPMPKGRRSARDFRNDRSFMVASRFEEVGSAFLGLALGIRPRDSIDSGVILRRAYNDVQVIISVRQRDIFAT